MIRITVVLLTCATALTACGTAPTEQTTATQLPAATVLPTDLPTVLPSTVAPSAAPEATDAPTVAAATKTANLASPVQKGYVSLVLIKGIAVMLDDTAQRSQAGQLKGFEGFGRLIAIGAFYKAISENLAKDAPDPALQAGWEQARMVLPKLQNVLAQLSDKKITTADVPALTAPIHTEIDQMLDTAEAGLSAAYGTDPAKLKEIRDKAITDLQNTLSATPTPKP
ncbi:MAG TPA: hypothetical protein VKE41_16025 [Roseiflexaceae bacterium]|nr:hypothetical protein [Roseiflexaceae bacterium]